VREHFLLMAECNTFAGERKRGKGVIYGSLRKRAIEAEAGVYFQV
jgi:hypothetical protein